MPGINDMLAAPGQQDAPLPSMQADKLPGFVRVVERLAKRIDAVQSPYGREVYRSVMEQALSQATNGLIREIPSQADLALKEQQRDLINQQLIQQSSKARASLAMKGTLDADPATKALYNITDESMQTDPDKWIAFVNGEGLTEEPLTRGDLLQAGYDLDMLTPEGRARKQQEAAVKEMKAGMEAQRSALSLTEAQAAHPVQMGKSRAETAELLSETQQGEGVYGSMLEGAQEEVEGATGTDLSSSLFGPDVDFDEPRGALALNQMYDLAQARIGSDLGRNNVADLLLSRFGEDIVDQLEEVTDEEGNIQIGAGAAGVHADAVPLLLGFLRRVAADKGVPMADVLASIKSRGRVTDQKAFDQSLMGWAGDYAKRTKQEPQGVLEAVFGRKVR